jgi:FtsZ-binding cell division protein ZapB
LVLNPVSQVVFEDLMNKMMTEIKTMRNEIKDLKNESQCLKNEVQILKKENEKFTNKSKILKRTQAVKIFEFSHKTVYCYIINTKIEMRNYKNFNLLYELDWYRPDSSEEANNIIDYFAGTYSNFIRGDDPKVGVLAQLQYYYLYAFTPLITYGVSFEPSNFTLNGYKLNVGGNGSGNPGRGFCAFRKNCWKFCSCLFDLPEDYIGEHFAVICLQESNS